MNIFINSLWIFVYMSPFITVALVALTTKLKMPEELTDETERYRWELENRDFHEMKHVIIFFSVSITLLIYVLFTLIAFLRSGGEIHQGGYGELNEKLTNEKYKEIIQESFDDQVIYNHEYDQIISEIFKIESNDLKKQIKEELK